MDESEFTIDCTGDVVAGDTILFTEGVFIGGDFSAFSRPAKNIGTRKVIAEVVRESHSDSKEQRTFTLRVIRSEGCQALAPNEPAYRKARIIYRNGTRRKPWADESQRQKDQLLGGMP